MTFWQSILDVCKSEEDKLTGHNHGKSGTHCTAVWTWAVRFFITNQDFVLFSSIAREMFANLMFFRKAQEKVFVRGEVVSCKRLESNSQYYWKWSIVHFEQKMCHLKPGRNIFFFGKMILMILSQHLHRPGVHALPIRRVSRAAMFLTSLRFAP